MQTTLAYGDRLTKGLALGGEVQLAGDHLGERTLKAVLLPYVCDDPHKEQSDHALQNGQ
jgi:hypothetical protein